MELIKNYYYSIEKKIPMNKLEYERQCFIQVYVGDKPYLRFGGPNYEEILRETLSKLGVPREFVKNSILIKEDTNNYKLVGKGRAKKVDDYVISLNGSCDKEHADKISKLTGLEIFVNNH